MDYQSAAIACLREASEKYLVELFEDACLRCLLESRVTLNVEDLRLAQISRCLRNPQRK